MPVVSNAIAITSSLVALSVGLLIASVIHRKKDANALALISPSAVFLLGILARFALGSLIISFTPRSLVLAGEYRQYMVSWKYSGEVACIWIAFTVAGACVFAVLERLKTERKRIKGNKVDKCGRGWFDWIKEKRCGRGYGWSELKLVVAACLGIFLVGSSISAVTGSMDRGIRYDYFASMAFRPEAAFIAFARFKQIGYLLLPLVWKECSKRLRVLLAVFAICPLVLEAIAGGRGAVLYPLVMLFVGYMCVSLKPKEVILVGALLVIFVGIAVPYMAAYRDSSSMRSKSHEDIMGRLGSLIRGVERERVAYRYLALGREIYACSDGFIIEAVNEKGNKLKESGFSDISLNTLRGLLVPRWLSEDKSYEKGDGAVIAKELMGVTNKTWFPCISTPADLFRREGWAGVIAGGGVMGFVIWCLETVWVGVGERKRNLETLLLTVLPATYIQTGLYGTVREVLWQLLWDLPKYIIAIVALGRLASWLGDSYKERVRR